MQQEQTFSKKIENLQQKLARKDEDLQEMDSIVQQLRHDLKTVQQEKVSASGSSFATCNNLIIRIVEALSLCFFFHVAFSCGFFIAPQTTKTASKLNSLGDVMA